MKKKRLKMYVYKIQIFLLKKLFTRKKNIFENKKRFQKSVEKIINKKIIYFYQSLYFIILYQYFKLHEQFFCNCFTQILYSYLQTQEKILRNSKTLLLKYHLVISEILRYESKFMENVSISKIFSIKIQRKIITIIVKSLAFLVYSVSKIKYSFSF